MHDDTALLFDSLKESNQKRRDMEIQMINYIAYLESEVERLKKEIENLKK